MQLSITIAQIMGIYFTIIALAIFINPKGFQLQIERFAENSTVVFLGTIFALIIGIILVVIHNSWVARWPVLITILGWFILIRSTIYLCFPKAVETMLLLFKTTKAIYISAVISLILGLYLLYQGFFGY